MKNLKQIDITPPYIEGLQDVDEIDLDPNKKFTIVLEGNSLVARDCYLSLFKEVWPDTWAVVTLDAHKIDIPVPDKKASSGGKALWTVKLETSFDPAVILEVGEKVKVQATVHALDGVGVYSLYGKEYTLFSGADS